MRAVTIASLFGCLHDEFCVCPDTLPSMKKSLKASSRRLLPRSGRCLPAAPRRHGTFHTTGNECPEHLTLGSSWHHISYDGLVTTSLKFLKSVVQKKMHEQLFKVRNAGHFGRFGSRQA